MNPTVMMFLAGIAVGVMGTLGAAALLMRRPDDYEGLEHVPPRLRGMFIRDRRLR